MHASLQMLQNWDGSPGVGCHKQQEHGQQALRRILGDLASRVAPVLHTCNCLEVLGGCQTITMQACQVQVRLNSGQVHLGMMRAHPGLQQ